MTESNKKKDLYQIIKFGVVGFLNTAIDYLLFALFFSILNIDKSISQIFATSIAMTNSYILNRYFTFRKKGVVRLQEMFKFVVVNLVSMGVTIVLLFVFYDIMHIESVANILLLKLSVPFSLSGDAAVLFCKLLATPFSLAVNFIGNKLWVFASKKTQKTKKTRS